MIDIKKLLSLNNIFYVTEGPNTKRGEVSISCPLCRGEDPSQHLGINLTTGEWGCWRNKKHRGSKLNSLLRILGIESPDERVAIMQQLLDKTFFNQQESESSKAKTKYGKATKLPDYLAPLNDRSDSQPYYRYIDERGFDNPKAVTKEYGLLRGTSKWHGRLVIPFPIYDEYCWTGRSILPNNTLRYLSPLPEESRNIKDCLFNYNNLLDGGDTLIITEGPIDSMKVDWYCKPSVRATCLFGMWLSPVQEELLLAICPSFNKVIIALDRDTLSESLDVMKQLSKFSAYPIQLPKKDFGDMSKEEIQGILL